MKTKLIIAAVILCVLLVSVATVCVWIQYANAVDKCAKDMALNSALIFTGIVTTNTIIGATNYFYNGFKTGEWQ